MSEQLRRPTIVNHSRPPTERMMQFFGRKASSQQICRHRRSQQKPSYRNRSHLHCYGSPRRRSCKFRPHRALPFQNLFLAFSVSPIAMNIKLNKIDCNTILFIVNIDESFEKSFCTLDILSIEHHFNENWYLVINFL